MLIMFISFNVLTIDYELDIAGNANFFLPPISKTVPQITLKIFKYFDFTNLKNVFCLANNHSKF
jgi:hypothetical protein